MNLPLNKDKVLSRLEKVLSNITGIKVVTAISDELILFKYYSKILNQ